MELANKARFFIMLDGLVKAFFLDCNPYKFAFHFEFDASMISSTYHKLN